MDRYAVFVDAGYFFAAGSQSAFDKSRLRKDIEVISIKGMIEALCEAAQEQSGGIALLRVYWYDAIPGQHLPAEQQSLALQDNVKVRLGALNNQGQQKGVDSLLVTDIIDLARNRAITDAVIVTGDEDLRIAVQVAQSFGVRVHILASGDPKRNVSHSLQMEADTLRNLDCEWFKTHLRLKNQPIGLPVQPSVVDGDKPTESTMSFADAGKQIITELLNELDPLKITELDKVLKSSKQVPSDSDTKLIARTRDLSGIKKFTGDEMRTLRGMFIAETNRRAKS
jgi:uncharacterized LabA/DUF88 family protein